MRRTHKDYHGIWGNNSKHASPNIVLPTKPLSLPVNLSDLCSKPRRSVINIVMVPEFETGRKK